ncbi:cation:H+ antiporter [Desulfobaculum xiamenense]|uniref:Cation:H+ antiporter n=1 Tax=Desulfobaculum xiamenense TaxID=995050 RepID=A0A846QLW9_9BACT|nr:calcium/sodium antiporter [Desulfobaculum xiamenense]NJB69101.1 cation:H+ antiporter [Desulfobaculum xiamenense]
MLTQFIFVIISATLLWFGAEWVVDSASAIARRFRVPELVIGLTVVAIGTSAPEFIVTAMASFKGMSDISLSNVVGSNVFNLGIILGSMAMLRPIVTTPEVVRRDGMLLIAVVSLVTLLTMDHTLSRVDGLVLAAILGTYITLLIIRRPRTAVVADENPSDERIATWKDYPRLAAGFVAVSYGGSLMVDAASTLAAHLGVSQWAIGVTIVAAGTSLPELVTCIAASVRGKNDMLLGNLIGSDLFNFCGVLGLTSILRPLPVSAAAAPTLYMLVGSVCIIILCIRTGWKVSRPEGAFLIALGLARWAPSLM